LKGKGRSIKAARFQSNEARLRSLKEWTRPTPLEYVSVSSVSRARRRLRHWARSISPVTPSWLIHPKTPIICSSTSSTDRSAIGKVFGLGDYSVAMNEAFEGKTAGRILLTMR
jgi:hypothetical protein